LLPVLFQHRSGRVRSTTLSGRCSSNGIRAWQTTMHPLMPRTLRPEHPTHRHALLQGVGRSGGPLPAAKARPAGTVIPATRARGWWGTSSQVRSITAVRSPPAGRQLLRIVVTNPGDAPDDNGVRTSRTFVVPVSAI
jgi:hypothetical protein